MRNPRLYCAVALLAVLAPVAAHAQSDDAADPLASVPERSAAQRELDLEVSARREALVEPAGDAPTGVTPSSVSIVGSTDSTSAVLTITPTKNPSLTEHGETTLAFTLKAPLNGAGDQGSFVTEQGIPNKFSAGFGFTWVSSHLSEPTGEEADAIEGLWRDCRKAMVTLEDYPKDLTSPPANAALRRDAERDLAQSRENFLQGKCPSAAGLRGLSEKALDQMAAQNLLTPERRAQITAYRKRLRAPIFLLNVSGSLGYKSFSSLNQADFSKRKTERMPYSFTVSAGLSLGGGSPYLAAGYQLRSDYKDADKRVVCPVPPAPPANNACKYEVFDLPKDDMDHSAFALMRIGGPFSISPGNTPMIEIKVAYDFEDDVFGVDVPIYFFVDKDKGLRGGIRFSWEERGNDPTKDTTRFGVFLVKSFDPFN